MTVSDKHPLYEEHLPDWQKLRDCESGQRAIKNKAAVYLPPTEGMVHDGLEQATSPGTQAYNAYRMRAYFPPFVSDAIKRNLGAMHYKPATITLPTVMEPLIETATPQGESLQMLLQRINEEQLITGRCGLLVDLAESADPASLPYITLYQAEKIINWDDASSDPTMVRTLNMLVLDESDFLRTDTFTWEHRDMYRVCILGEPNENEVVGTYSVGLYDEEQTDYSLNMDLHVEPVYRGKTLDFVPFTFCNVGDVVSEPDRPPYNGMADLNLAIYRGQADWRQALFMTGQDTLVIKNGNPDEEYRLGSQGGIILQEDADAKFVGVTPTGLVEMRLAMKDDTDAAAQMGGALIDSVSRERESGDALNIRVSARTASLTQIARTGAFALQSALRDVAVWVGANPDEVSVEANLDFVDNVVDARNLSDLMMAKTQGAPLSLESIHSWEYEHGLTTKTFEEELAAIEEEADLEIVKEQKEMQASEKGAPVTDEENGDDNADTEQPVSTDDGEQ